MAAENWEINRPRQSLEYSDRDVGQAVTAAVSSFSSSCETQKAHVAAILQRADQVVELMHYLKAAPCPSSLTPSILPSHLLSLTLGTTLPPIHSGVTKGQRSPAQCGQGGPPSPPLLTAMTLPHQHT